MITKMSKADVIELGSRNRAGYLLKQYGYTMGLAKLDGAALADLLPDGYLEDVKKVADEVHEALKEKTLIAEESKSSTEQVNDLIRQAKVWRRAIVSCSLRAKRLGEKIPDGLLKADNLSGVAAVSIRMDAMVKLAVANQDILPGKTIKALIKEGQELLTKIGEVDSAHEVKRLKSLPESVQNFYYQKGLLYTGIKVINDAGRELHAGDPPSAAKYNLSILYRITGKRKAKKEN
jgi:hypothetical protein